MTQYESLKTKDVYADYFMWRKGRRMVQAGKYDDAAAVFTEMLSRDPRSENSDRARFWLHKIYLIKKDTALAENMFNEMALYNTDSTLTWVLVTRYSREHKAADLASEFNSAIVKRDAKKAAAAHAMLLCIEKSMTQRNLRIYALSQVGLNPYAKMEGMLAKSFSSKYRSQCREMEKHFCRRKH